jgi:hypothetical protein
MNETTDCPVDEWFFELQDWWTASALRHVDKTLCGEVGIHIDEDGKFIMTWGERHPELGGWEDFWGDEERTTVRIESAEWLDMLERLPSTEHEAEVTQAEAFELFVRALLPSELHRNAGLE